MVAQPQLEDVEGMSKDVFDGETPQADTGEAMGPHQPEGISPQKPVEIDSQYGTETLNVLVNDGSSVGAYTIDLIAPPKLNLEITQLHTLEPKRFLRDLRNGKVKQICILFAEDEYVTDTRSAVVFTEMARVLSITSMDQGGLEEKTQIERYRSQSL